MDFKADRAEAMAEPADEGSSARIASVAQAIGRLGFCEGYIGN